MIFNSLKLFISEWENGIIDCQEISNLHLKNLLICKPFGSVFPLASGTLPLRQSHQKRLTKRVRGYLYQTQRRASHFPLNLSLGLNFHQVKSEKKFEKNVMLSLYINTTF